MTFVKTKVSRISSKYFFIFQYYLLIKQFVTFGFFKNLLFICILQILMSIRPPALPLWPAHCISRLLVTAEWPCHNFPRHTSSRQLAVRAEGAEGASRGSRASRGTWWTYPPPDCVGWPGRTLHTSLASTWRDRKTSQVSLGLTLTRDREMSLIHYSSHNYDMRTLVIPMTWGHWS